MADKNGIFDYVDPGVKIYRSKFNRSYQKLIDAYPGFLYPIYTANVVPGDIVKLGLRWNVKANPSVTPYFTRVKASVFYFVVPWSQIFGIKYGDPSDSFIQDLISGGQLDSTTQIPIGDGYTVPTFNSPSMYCDINSNGLGLTVGSSTSTFSSTTPYLSSLSNCFGYPSFRIPLENPPSTFPTVKLPLTQTWHRAYWKIVSDYFIDEDTMPDAVDWIPKFDSTDQTVIGTPTNYPYRTMFSRDYFMSSLKSFLKGVPPALNLGSVQIPAGSIIPPTSAGSLSVSILDGSNFAPVLVNNVGSTGTVTGFRTGASPGTTVRPLLANFLNLNDKPVGIPSSNLTFPVNASLGVDELRLAFATQRILERANRCGSRYTEYLLSTFGTAPADGTLRRPYYLGGVRFNVVTPEVLQTSESGTTPQGNRAGVGFSVGDQRIHTYKAKEFGTIMALLNIEPEATYFGGAPREALAKSRYDFFNPSMQNLSEQVVQKGEIWADVTNSVPSYDPTQGFGYQGLWNEMRTSFDQVSGNFRYGELNNWHMGLTYSSAPNLSKSFKTIWNYKGDIMRPFAVQNMPPFLCQFYHDATWVRPMVKFPVPGLIDHN